MPDASYRWTTERKTLRHKSARGNWRVFLYVWGGEDKGWVQREEHPALDAADCDARAKAWLAGAPDAGPVFVAGEQETLFTGLTVRPSTG